MDRTSRPAPRVLSRKPPMGKSKGCLKALLRESEFNPMMSELRELRADIYELNRSLDGSTISFALRKGDLARSKTSATASLRTDLQSPSTSIGSSASPRTPSPSARSRPNRNKAHHHHQGRDEIVSSNTCRRSHAALAPRGGHTSSAVDDSDYELKIRFPPPRPTSEPRQAIPPRTAIISAAGDAAERCRRGVHADYGGATDVGQVVRRVQASARAVSREKDDIVRGLRTEQEKTARLRVALEREGTAKREWETLTEASRALKVRLESTERIRKRQKELIKELQAVEADIAFANAGSLAGRASPHFSLALFSSPPPPPPPPPTATRRGKPPSSSLLTLGRDQGTGQRDLLDAGMRDRRRGECHTADRIRVSSQEQQIRRRQQQQQRQRSMRSQSAKNALLDEGTAAHLEGGNNDSRSAARRALSSGPQPALMGAPARTRGRSTAAVSRAKSHSSRGERETVGRVGVTRAVRRQRAGNKGGGDLGRTRRASTTVSISSRRVAGAGVDLGFKPEAAATQKTRRKTSRRLSSSSVRTALQQPVSSLGSNGGRQMTTTTKQQQHQQQPAPAATATATATRKVTRWRNSTSRVEVLPRGGETFGAPTAASAGKVLRAKRAVTSSRAPRAGATKRGADARLGEKGRRAPTSLLPTRRKSSSTEFRSPGVDNFSGVHHFDP